MTEHRGADLFVGVTAWNSETLLSACLDSVRRTVPEAEVVVLDNGSEDGTREVAAQLAVRTVVRRCSQGDALDELVRRSTRPLTLLAHADVVLLSPDWLETTKAALHRDGSILVSPEDVGCGPFTRREHGRGMPESSFLLFRTASLPRLQIRRWHRRWRIPYLRRKVDFFGEHVTYNLPGRMEAAGLRWSPMEVYPSPREEHPLYTSSFPAKHWSADLGHLRYGLGNFYGLDGAITHYHNWYDRRLHAAEAGSTETSEPGGAGVPLDFIRACTERFLDDYRAGSVRLPAIATGAEE